ncbi:MAG: Xaa-Pro aminopeptidase [Gaiellaceae bacterium]
MTTELRHIPLPEPEVALESPTVSVEEYDARMDALYARCDHAWVVVYGDREHAANLSFLCNFDPRFEEALLVLGPPHRRVLLVGNEGVDYASSTSPNVDVMLCQSLSLLGQSRDSAPRLDRGLADIGIGPGDDVGVVGWKYLTAEETDDPGEPAFVPAFVIAALRRLTGEPLRDCTQELMDAGRGLRTRNSAAQIALFEWGATRAAAAVMRIVAGAEPGMTELEAAGRLGYQGEPLTCHLMLSGGKGTIVGLRSPTARLLEAGDAVTTAVGYTGGLCARAGLLRREPDDAFFAEIVAPYHNAIAAWYAAVGVGVEGGAVWHAVLDALESVPFRPALNPGHLVSFEEWLHSPIRSGGCERLASGMALQCDIIPAPLPRGRALNCEDTVALADEQLRGELARDYADLWRRIERRRAFMCDELGIELGEDVLPLSESGAYLPPFWLDETLVCVRS